MSEGAACAQHEEGRHKGDDRPWRTTTQQRSTSLLPDVQIYVRPLTEVVLHHQKQVHFTSVAWPLHGTGLFPSAIGIFENRLAGACLLISTIARNAPDSHACAENKAKSPSLVAVALQLSRIAPGQSSPLRRLCGLF